MPEVYLRELARLIPRLREESPHIGEPGPLNEGWQRRLLFESIAYALRGAQPVLLMVDDLQWCDADSILAAPEYLLRSDTTARCMLLATARIDAGQSPAALFRDSKLSALITDIELAPLGREDTLHLAETQVPAPVFSSPSRQAMVDASDQETEGNPLFVVELMRSGWAPGSDSTPPLPPSLQAAIRARFAQLPDACTRAAGLAATTGTALRLPILTHASGQSAGDMVRNIDELWRQRIIREQGADSYEFTHGKLREVAYADLSAARRAHLHERVVVAYHALQTCSRRLPRCRNCPASSSCWTQPESDAGRAHVEAADIALAAFTRMSRPLPITGVRSELVPRE